MHYRSGATGRIAFAAALFLLAGSVTRALSEVNSPSGITSDPSSFENSEELWTESSAYWNTLITEIPVVGALWAYEFDEQFGAKWYVEAESLFLWRDNRGAVNRQYAMNDINTRAVTFDVGIGPQITLGFRVDENNSWEAEYFSALDMDGSATGFYLDYLSPLLQFPGEQSTNESISYRQVATRIDYESDLHNAEINYLFTLDQFSLISGFRYVQFTEDFADWGRYKAFARNHTVNNLYGGQLGIRWRHAYKRLSLDATGKAGVFGNDVALDQTWREIHSSRTYHQTKRHDSTVAFVGDINVSAAFRLTRIWGVRAGYNVMWLNQVALAPDQTSWYSRNLAMSGGVFLHGANVGIEANW